jgi:hypothetical protein
MGITMEQFRVMQARVEQNRQPAAATPAAPPTPVLQSVLSIDPSQYECYEFVYKGMPVGKPRMTQRDRWKKRPIVLRYYAFKDLFVAAAGPVPPDPDIVIAVARVPMPKSWSMKKKRIYAGQPCRAKPDWDNLGKACCDALFAEDSPIWAGLVVKYWCHAGQESIQVKLYYAKRA